MKTCVHFAFVVFISKYTEVFSDNKVSLEKYEGKGLTSEGVGLLNGTYFNLNETVCQLQKRVDTIEGMTDVDNQSECYKEAVLEFKRSISNELKGISKILSGFENDLRILENEQEGLRLILDGGDIDVTMSTPTSELVCEDGWILSPGKKCYYVSTTSEKTEWATAINRCRDMGAKLVEFKTDEEAQFVMGNLPERVSTISIVYTGRKSDDAGRWVFLSNDERVDTSERSWSSGQPDGTQTCGCTRKSDDFLMLDCFCTGYHLFYICENLPTASTMTTPEPTTEPRNCYDGWITSPDKCYYVSTYSEKTEWATAISRCKSKGAILVEIKTDEESRFIMENLPSRVGSTDVVYTGRIRNDANIWVFVSNAEKVDATVRSWARGEPNGGSNQECGCTRTSDDFLMHDCFCTRNSLFYICEIER